MSDTVFFATDTAADDRVRVELVRPPALCHALVHNDVPVVRHLRVDNTGDTDLTALTVTVELTGPDGVFAAPWTRLVATLPPGGSVAWDDLADLEPDRAAMRAADEAFRIAYRVTVTTADGVESRLVAASRVLARNEWLNHPGLYELICAFVQPNAPAVTEVLRDAAHLLLAATGSGDIAGHQHGAARAAEIASALYQALRDRRITYVEAPASFEETGQKVRATADVLRERIGNCIDLTVTYAACLEAAGLRPLIWIVEGHAFAGFFRSDDRLPEPVVLEPAQMINLVESGRAVAVELTGVGPGDASLDFAEAVEQGRAHLRGHSKLYGLVDVHLAHRGRLKPLPSTDASPSTPAAWTAAAAAVTAAAQAATAGTPTSGGVSMLSVPAVLRTDDVAGRAENLEPHAADDGAPPRVVAWRRSLLDLSLRNPLLKLPKRGKGLELHVPADSLATLDDLVHQGKAIHIAPQDVVGGVHELRGVRRAQDLPDDMLAEELARDRRVYGAVTQAAYVRRMRDLQRDARTLQQETGGNYLYLTLGSLVHPTPTGEAHAPLFLLPVRVDGGAGRRPFAVLIDGDELAAPNHCLVQWLRVRHGVRIPELENPVTDLHGIDIAASFTAIRAALVDNRLPYRVDESASLRLLQFATFQMWRDLTTHWRTFLDNDVVRHLVENSGTPLVDEPPHVDVDEASLHLPIAADGSQMRAITLAERGASFVLEGPPGTGKSQTITNLIAHLVRSGRTVLFVAEKQAALDVVKRRLAAVGLDDFCLDLHGRKQTARSIHKQLKASFERTAASDDHAWQGLDATHRARTAALRGYPDRIHTPNAGGFSAWTARQACLAHGDGPAAPVPEAYFRQPDELRVAAARACQELPAAARSARLRPAHPWSISGLRDVAGVAPAELAAAARELEHVRALVVGDPPGPHGRPTSADALDRPPDPRGRSLAATVHAGLPEPLRARIAELPSPAAVADVVAAARLAAAGALPSAADTDAAERPGWDDATAAAHDAVAACRQRHDAVLVLFRAELFTSPDLDRLVELAAAAGKGVFGKKGRRAVLADALRRHRAGPGVIDETTAAGLVDALIAARADAAAVEARVRAIAGLRPPPRWRATDPDATAAIRAAHHACRVSRELRRAYPGVWHAFAELGPRVPAPLVERLAVAWRRLTDLLATTPADLDRWAAPHTWWAAWQRDGAGWAADVDAGLLPVQRWAAVRAHADVLTAAGLGEFAEQVLRGTYAADDLEIAHVRGVACAALAERLRAGELDFFDAGAHEHLIRDRLRVGAAIRDALPGRLAAGLLDRRAAATPRFRARAGELIRRLNSRSDRLSFRDACAQQPDVVTALTPCFLVSPGSVANFVAPGSLTFDLVVFDEASQIRVAQAIGAMGRGRSVIVVGDSKQMPPTSIMEAAHDDTDSDAAVPQDLDSILTECVESGLPRESLTWHYRSADESLIAFSNTHYYESRLASLPSPGGDGTTGVSWRRVDGRFDRGTGASRTNAVEAAAVVDEIAALLADPRTAGRSIGVVTFNVQQRDLLLDLLEDSPDQLVQDALARQDGEALFVKNLENVQGDERDVILFSLAFSTDPETGRLPLNFGPLSLVGGERRLNVAVTRARSQVILFSSFDPADIDLARTRALGTQHLRAYLELAAKGVTASGDATSTRHATADRVADEIADALRARGHEVARHHGLSHFTVDLAVRRPGADRWQVAVLLDGPRWAARPTVADRDAAPELLTGVMRWDAVVRVWLPQWLADRETVLTRVDTAVADAAAAAEAPPAVRMPEPQAPVEQAHVEPPQPAGEQPPASSVAPGIATPEPTAAGPRRWQPPPLRTDPDVPARVQANGEVAPPLADQATRRASDDAVEVAVFEPWRPPVAGDREQIDRLASDPHAQRLVRDCMDAAITTEGPIETDRLLRLVHRAFGLHKMHADRRRLMRRHLPSVYRTTRSGDAEFVWPHGLDPESWTGFRRTVTSADRAVHEISYEEIANAMRDVLHRGAAASPFHLYRGTRELLGYGRTTVGMEAMFARVVAWGVTSGRLPERLVAD